MTQQATKTARVFASSFLVQLPVKCPAHLLIHCLAMPLYLLQLQRFLVSFFYNALAKLTAYSTGREMRVKPSQAKMKAKRHYARMCCFQQDQLKNTHSHTQPLKSLHSQPATLRCRDQQTHLNMDTNTLTPVHTLSQLH